MAYSQLKFDEKLVGVIDRLVRAIILELDPNFGSKSPYLENRSQFQRQI